MKPKAKLSLLTLFIITLVFPAFAQDKISYSIKGTVVDSSTQKGMEYVTVALKTTENKPVKSAVTSAKGEFTFEKIPAGSYKLNIVSVGHKSETIPLEIKGDKLLVHLGQIKLSSQNNALKEVSVTADRPLIKQEIDRIAYDVQADPENKVNSVLEMLRKVPLVSVDADDNIKVKGSGSYKVLINGRPSSLVARDPKEVFKSMPASNIQKIEIITTPPAKYDSEGLAGIINIITNKKVDQGMNGSVSSRYSFPGGPGGNAQITVKEGKFGLSSYLGMNRWGNPGTTFFLSRTAHPSETNLLTDGQRKNSHTYSYSNAELSFEIDSLNLITGEFGYNSGIGNSDFFQGVIQSSASSAENMSYRVENKGKNKWQGYELGLNYQLGFKRNKDQLLTASYKFNGNADDNSNDFLTYDRVNYSGGDNMDYGQNNQSGSKEQTIQLDYLHPIKKLNVEGGMKVILRDNHSDFEYGNYDLDGAYVINESRSNRFNYDQNVYSFYNSYQLKLKNWGLKSGLRLERTAIDARFISLNSGFKVDYNNFIPSVSVQRKFKNKASMTLGYTQRIQRPSIWELNPYEEQLNQNFVRSGNTELDAVRNHNFDLNYSLFKKGSINTGLSYSFANNTIQHVSRLQGAVTRTTFENIGKNKSLGLNINTNQQPNPSFNINLNGSVSYRWLEGMIDNNLIKNEGVQGNIYGYAGYKLKKDFRVGVNVGFYSGWLTLQGQSNPYYYSSASLSKELLKKKLTLSGSVNNPFQKFRSWENNISTASFTQIENFQNYYRNYRFNVSYKFGKLKGEIKKNRRGIKNDDVAGKSSSE